MKTRIYYNLHKHCLSVQQKVAGRWKVVKHVDEIALRNVQFKVSAAGRDRVLRERRKNVHAFVEGEEIPFIPKTFSYQDEITYNPYKHETFVVSNYYHKPVDRAKYVKINGKKIVAILSEYNGQAV